MGFKPRPPVPSLTLPPPGPGSLTSHFCGNYSENSKSLFSTRDYKYLERGRRDEKTDVLTQDLGVIFFCKVPKSILNSERQKL